MLSTTMVSASRAFATRPATRPTKVIRSTAAAAAMHKVTFVRPDGTEKTIECSSDDYLLDAADESGIDMPASCRGGVCGTCVSKLLSGKVDSSWLTELDDGNVLTAEQMEAGFILPCSVKPLSDLKLQYSLDWGVSVLEGWKQTARA